MQNKQTEQGCIYIVENDVNELKYVGQTTQSLSKRFADHCNAQDNMPLHQAIRDLGREHFKIRKLERCRVEDLDRKERVWIWRVGSFRNGYNMTKGGRGGSLRFNYRYIEYLLNRGDSVSEICDIVGCKKDTVYKVAKKHNIKPRMGYLKVGRNIICRYDGGEMQFGNLELATEMVYESGLANTKNKKSIMQNIRRCCDGLRKKAYGAEWSYGFRG